MKNTKSRWLSSCCGQFSLDGLSEDRDGHYNGKCGMCKKQADFLEDSSPLHPHKKLH